MAFIKRCYINGENYYYLVKSVRERGAPYPHHKIIHYLGGDKQALGYAKEHGLDFPKQSKTEKKDTITLDERIAGKLKRLKGYRKQLAAMEDNLKEELVVNWTYNSNAIEGNTLTWKDTYRFLKFGKTVSGRPITDYYEAENHGRAINYLYSLAGEKRLITEDDIRHLQAIVVEKTRAELRAYEGKYRDGEVHITGSAHVPPLSDQVPFMMQDLMKFLKRAWSRMDPVQLSAEFHAEFENIHPFFDGNGRTGRLVSNYILMKKGYPPIVVKNAEKDKYYRALEGYSLSSDKYPLVKLFKKCTEERLDYLLGAVGAKVGSLKNNHNNT